MPPLDLLPPLVAVCVDCGSQPVDDVVLPVRLPKSANGSLLAVDACDAAPMLRWPLLLVLLLLLVWPPPNVEALELIGVSGTLAALKLGSRLSKSDAVVVLEVLATFGADDGVDVVVKLAKSRFRLAAFGWDVMSEPNRSSMPLVALVVVLPIERQEHDN